MPDQTSFFNLFSSTPSVDSTVPTRYFKILAWNVQNPSLERAKRQVSWLKSCDADVLVLSEIKAGKAMGFILEELELNGFRLFYNANNANPDDYYTVIAVRMRTALELPLLISDRP